MQVFSKDTHFENSTKYGFCTVLGKNFDIHNPDDFLNDQVVLTEMRDMDHSMNTF